MGLFGGNKKNTTIVSTTNIQQTYNNAADFLNSIGAIFAPQGSGTNVSFGSSVGAAYSTSGNAASYYAPLSLTLSQGDSAIASQERISIQALAAQTAAATSANRGGIKGYTLASLFGSPWVIAVVAVAAFFLWRMK